MGRFEFITTQEIDSRILQATTFALRIYENWVTARNAAFPDAPFPSLSDLSIF